MLTIHFGEKPSLQLGGLGGQPNLLISIANTMVIFYFFIFIFWLLAASPNLGILISFSLGFLESKVSGIVFYFLGKLLSGGTGLGQLQCLGRSGTTEVCDWLIGWGWPACSCSSLL